MNRCLPRLNAAPVFRTCLDGARRVQRGHGLLRGIHHCEALRRRSSRNDGFKDFRPLEQGYIA